MKRSLAAYIGVSLSIWMAIGVFCSHIFMQPAQAAGSMPIHCMGISASDSNILPQASNTSLPDCCVSQNDSSSNKPATFNGLSFDLQAADLTESTTFSITKNQTRIKCLHFSQAPPGLVLVNTTILRE
ncbi:MAG: hypothetical protein WCW31_01010 [Patescibacteria group bacterium]